MKQAQHDHIDLTDRVFLIGIGLACLYWVLDAAVGDAFSSELTFVQSLFPQNSSTLALRIFGAAILVMFGVFTQGIINQRKWMEEKDQQHHKELELLSDTAMRFIELPLDADIYQFIGEQLKTLVNNAIVIVTVFDEVSEEFTVRVALGHEEHAVALTELLERDLIGMTFAMDTEHRIDVTSSTLVKVPGGIYGLCHRQFSGEVCAQVEKLLRCGDTYVIGLTKKEGLFGNAVILVPKGETLCKQHLIETFANQASVALMRRDAEENLRTLSLVDELTGLYNRRGFFTLASQQMKVAQRAQHGLMLLYVDIDGMKWINDTLGHQQGDVALMETATILKETFRKSDIIARIGGDEFVALAIGVDEESARIITARLSGIVAQRNQQSTHPFKLSLSTGAALYDTETPCTIHDLLVRADSSMYEAKRSKSSVS